MSTPHTPTTVQQASPLLSLPPELRNKIYDYVLADVQDNVCIDLEGKDNIVHKVVAKKTRSVPTEDKTSRLSLFLTCRQINTEASLIAFSKMSMSLDTVFPNPADFDEDGVEVIRESGLRLGMIMVGVVNSFSDAKLAAISVMEFPNTRILVHLLTFDSPVLEIDPLTDSPCTAKCASLAQHQEGMIHHMLHNVKRIILNQENERFNDHYKALTKGASWLSVTMQHYQVEAVLSIFSNLEEIVVRREGCGEQVSKVIDGKIYAAESGLEMLGMDDWMPNLMRG